MQFSTEENIRKNVVARRIWNNKNRKRYREALINDKQEKRERGRAIQGWIHKRITQDIYNKVKEGKINNEEAKTTFKDIVILVTTVNWELYLRQIEIRRNI